MYDPAGYLWAIVIAGVALISAGACAVLYVGAQRAGLGRGRAALMAGGAAVVVGGWFAASAVIASNGWYDTPLGHSVPWMPIAVVGFFGTVLALSRIPVVKRPLTAPGMEGNLLRPHMFRVEGVAFLLYLALGHLPALFALPAGLGDIATALAAPVVARRLEQGIGCSAAVRLNAFGLTDLVVALALGGLTGFGLMHITPSGAPIAEAPLALVPTVGVPLLFVLHLTSLSTLRRARRSAPAEGPLSASATARPAPLTTASNQVLTGDAR